MRLLLSRLVVLILLLNGLNALAEDYTHPLIPVEKIRPIMTLPRYESLRIKDSFPTRFSLLQFLPENRDQGNCGSCWVWAGLGCTEIMFNRMLEKGQIAGGYYSNQSFSVNYVEAKAIRYKELIDYANSICEGGRPEYFTDLHSKQNGLNLLVPRTNINAGFPLGDGNNFTVTDINRIQTTPSVQLDDIELLEVVTDYDNLEQTKKEVISALLDGYPVQLDYYVYGNFYTHWNSQTENDLYSFPTPNPDNIKGGHAVIIVGYDISSSDPNNHHWIAANSWGTPQNRPNGLFNIRMNSALGIFKIVEYVIYKPKFKVQAEVCDNIDNNCNTVVDEGDCHDYCPDDPNKTAEGECGCGVSDTDSDFDGVADCNDGCPEDKTKIDPGFCGCGIPDSVENISDDDGNNIINCHEDGFLKYNAIKVAPYYRGQVSSGNAETTACISNELGDLYCIGRNLIGQLGDGTTRDKDTLTKVKALKGVSSFSLGIWHSCAIAKDENDDDKVYCWGYNGNGETGHKADSVASFHKFIPSKINLEIGTPKAVSCGLKASCVIADDDKSYCFGENTGGKLGSKGPMYETYQCVPNEAWNDGEAIYNGRYVSPPLNDVSAIDMASNETATIADGKLYNYGIHSSNMQRYDVANRYAAFNDVKALSISETDLCAITNSNELYCLDMYINPYFDGPKENTPTKVALENVTAVSAGSDIENGLFSDEIYGKFDLCCNADGMTLCSMILHSTDPESHVCAVSNDNLYCFGRGNSFGQLGSSVTNNLSIPHQVPGVSNITSLTTSGGITCYISNNEPYCFGKLTAIGIPYQGPIPHKIGFGASPSNVTLNKACNATYGKCSLSGTYQEINGRVVCSTATIGLNDSDNDGVNDCIDICTDAPDIDSDNDGVLDCLDVCPDEADIDSDNDGVADCVDGCPYNYKKTEPGICGCSTLDKDSDKDNVPNCIDECPYNPDKTKMGSCGCDESDVDHDDDGLPDCLDECPYNHDKFTKGICGCEVSDDDSDNDGLVDCKDECPNDQNKTEKGICGCGVSDIDSDKDGLPDCKDLCPSDPNKTEKGICGCGVSDIDSDKDGLPDCKDLCPNDPNKIKPGNCGCGKIDSPNCEEGKECPTEIATNLEIKKLKRQIRLTMQEIDSSCFKDNYIYRVRLTKKRKVFTYSSKKNFMTIKKLKKGAYTVSYRVLKKTKKGKKNVPVSSWSKKIPFKIK